MSANVRLQKGSHLIRSLTFFSAALLIFTNVMPVKSADFDTLDHKIFIGQAYPSGNVYLRRFVEKEEPNSEWPRELQVISVASQSDIESPIGVQFVQLLESKIENNVVKSVFIPGIEGMNDSHNSCGLGQIKKVDPAFKTLSGDFFDAILDHCEPNDGIAVFRGKPSNYSFLVFGVEKPYSLSKTKVIAKAKRPLTDTEKKQVILEKKESKTNASDFKCTTEPAYLDSAVQLFEATIDRSTSLRLSTYDNPGCGGHLASIYILDILKDNIPVKSFSISQYQGAL